IVVLDEKGRPAYGVVVTVTGGFGAGPGEGHRVEPAGFDPLPLRRGDLRRRALHVVAREAHERLALCAVEVRIPDAARRAVRIGGTVVLGEDVGGGYRVDDGDRLVRRGQSSEQLACELFLGSECALAGVRTVRYAGRVGAEEERRDGEQVALHER